MIKRLATFAFIVLSSGLSSGQEAKELPNILWITTEDNDYAWLGCYGNEQAQTPHLDKLAKEGVLFKHAYSNAPVCAVARSTILNGAYAVTQGTQHMRSKHKTSAKYKPYVSYLREQGYYCTNKTKTDYNYDGPYRELWDDSTNKADYKNRPKGSPFFAVINLTMSHESSLFPEKIERNRKKGYIPNKTRLDPSEVIVRPYLPDLPEIRSDIAIYHDNITATDTQIGAILKELHDSGLAEDTIIFHYSDHGGITPRGKRYLKETGVHVPMIVHVPEKWKHLSPFKNGQTTDEVVAFVDLAPTVLSLAGVETPEQMQGRAFLGKHRKEVEKDAIVFLYADRFDEFYGMRRGLVAEQGKWKYIRRFTPHLPAAPYSYFQFGQEGWGAWQKAFEKGALPEKYAKIWKANQEVEELYNLEEDPWEVNNLANEKDQTERIAGMRKRLREKMISSKDSGVIPEAMFAELAAEGTTGVITDYFDKSGVDINQIVDAADKGRELIDDVPIEKSLEGLKSESPVVRYWELQKWLSSAKKNELVEPEIKKLLNDQYSANRVAAAHVMFLFGEKEIASKVLLEEIHKDLSQHAILYAFNVIARCDLTDKVPEAWIEKAINIKDTKSYVRRTALQLKKAK